MTHALSFEYFHCFQSNYLLYLSRVVRKPDFCICENKDADQLRGYQHLCLHYIDSTISLIRNFNPLAIFYGCTARFVWHQVKTPENRFSHKEAHFISRRVFWGKGKCHFELRREKTCLWGFRPGPNTNQAVYSHRRCLEA